MESQLQALAQERDAQDAAIAEVRTRLLNSEDSRVSLYLTLQLLPTSLASYKTLLTLLL
jgi:hypothetical protein